MRGKLPLLPMLAACGGPVPTADLVARLPEPTGQAVADVLAVRDEIARRPRACGRHLRRGGAARTGGRARGPRRQALLLDCCTHFRNDAGSHDLVVDPRPVDAVRHLHEARWSG